MAHRSGPDVAGALSLSGCRGTEGPAPNPPTASTAAVSPAKVDDIAATVPEDVRSSGKLVVGVNIPYPPNEFKDPEGEIVGFDVDLMNAVAAVLGLTVDYRESDFAKIIPSIDGGTYNVGMSSFTDTKEREKQVDFVDLLLRRHAVGAASRAGHRPEQRVREEGRGAGDHHRRRLTNCLPRARRAWTPASRRSRSSSSTARTPPPTPCAGAGRRAVGRFTGHRLCDQAEQGQA